jgi:oligosaccharide repeat unit polymerase
MYIFLLSLGLIAAIVCVVKSISKKGTGAVASDPVVFFSLYFGIVHFLTPMVKYQTGIFRYQETYDPLTLIVTALMTLMLFVFAVLLSNYFGRGNSHRFTAHSSNHAYTRRTIWLGLLFFVVGAYFAYSDVRNISGIIEDISEFAVRRGQLGDARSSTRVFANLMLIGSMLFLVGWTCGPSKNRVLKVVIFISMMLFAANYYSILSSRNSILLLALFNLSAYFFYNSQKLSFSSKNLKSVLMAVLAVLTLSYTVYSVTVSRYSIVDNSYTRGRLDNIFGYMLDGAFGNDEALLWLAENEYSLFGGATYMAGVTNFVPRRFWPDKPFGGGPTLTNMIRPGTFAIGNRHNTSLTTGMLVEARMNFGIAGMFGIIVIWAYLANYFVRKAMLYKGHERKVMYLIVAIALSSSFVYSEFLGFLVRIALFFVPVWAASTAFVLMGKRT